MWDIVLSLISITSNVLSDYGIWCWMCEANSLFTWQPTSFSMGLLHVELTSTVTRNLLPVTLIVMKHGISITDDVAITWKLGKLHGHKNWCYMHKNRFDFKPATQWFQKRQCKWQRSSLEWGPYMLILLNYWQKTRLLENYNPTVVTLSQSLSSNAFHMFVARFSQIVQEIMSTNYNLPCTHMEW